MSRRLGSGRWSDVTEEVQPFGMPFVDIVASALICVVALLILWLQFINPLGHIPGHTQHKGHGTQPAVGQAGASSGEPDQGSRRYDTPGVLLSLLVKWPNGTAREKVHFVVECGENRQVWVDSNTDGFAATTLRITKGSTNCLVGATSNGAGQSKITVSSRVVTDGKQLHAEDFDVGSGSHNVLSASHGDALATKLGKKRGDRWPINWSQ